MTAQTWLLQAKLRPPGISPKCLPRTLLIEKLQDPGAARALLIDAPAGYGKTTLLGQLYHALRAQGVPVVWLTFDAHDNDPDELIRYLTSIFRRASSLRGDEEDHEEQGSSSASTRATVARLLGQATPAHRYTVFLFDDLHLLTSPECLVLVRMLLDDTSNDFRFVMASRGRPLLDVSKLEVQGTLDVLPAAEVSFSRDEVSLLLGNQPEELINDLYDKTQGWPVALKLFLTATARTEVSAQELVANLGEVPDIADYLGEQIMSQLSLELQDFLTVTSLPARITGALADRLCDRTDGWHILERLRQDSLFITRLEAEAGWYRYHDFFREFLRKRLAQQSSVDVNALHKRAAQWLFASRHFDEASHHAIEAGDWDLAIKALENAGGWHVAVERGSGAVQGIELIPEAAMQRSLLARLTLVYELMHFGQSDRARENLERVREDSERFTRWGGQDIDRVLRTECHSLEALVLVCEENPLPVEFVERIKADARAIGSRGRFVHMIAESSLSVYAHHDAGLYRECIRLAEEGVVALKEIKANFSLGYLHIYLGMSHFALGHLWLAQSWYRKAFDLATARFPHESQRLEALACLAETQYYEDDLDAARKNVRAVFDRLKRQSAVDSAVFQVAYPTAAALYARAGDLDSALSLLMEARTVARYLQRERRLEYIEIRRVEELTRAGYYADAAEVIRQEGFQRALSAPADAASIPLLAMNASLALARFELVTGDAASAEHRLSTLQIGADAYQNEIMKLRCLTVLTAAQFARGKHAESMQCLRSLCSRVIPSGLKRIVVDERLLIEPVIHYLLETGERQGTAAYANAQIVAERWLKKTDAPRIAPAAPAVKGESGAPPGVLSPRQREVLELLAAGFSGKEIATRLALSESTVKTYRKALYVKLGAGRRSQALANARRMSLLD